MQDQFDVVVIGAGAAGLAALRRLAQAPVSAVALEARSRIGGRAWTVRRRPDLPLDLGCGWVHSADVNPLAALFAEAGIALDKTPPAWERQAANQDFPPEDQRAFAAAYDAFEARLEAAARAGRDRPAAELLEPGGRWNALIDAVSSYYNGVEYDRVSVLDYDAYEDSGVNWRVPDGYGAAIAAFAESDRIVLDCPVTLVDHQGPELHLETPRGTVRARAAILTIPTPHLAQQRIASRPALSAKHEAAVSLPLGLADKVVLAVDEPDAFPAEQHMFGRPDRTETGSYHLRPFGRPYIEAFVGGRAARALEGGGPGAMAAFAIEELAGLYGSGVRRRLTPLAETAWAADPWALGAYSHALPGGAGGRAELARPVDGRLFFAGEATSAHAFSTAHGAWASGERAACEALENLALKLGAC